MVLAVSAVAIAVFLAFNSRLPGRARALTFMGNSGSAFLGLLLAWAAIRLTHDSVPAVTPALAPWLVALPIMDCLVLIVRRMREGRSPFDADRCHFHHLLLDRSWRVPSVVIVAALVHLGLGLFGLALHALGMPDLGLIVAFIAMTVVHYFVSGWLRAERGAAQLLTVASVISRD
jgi:UDP-GlcNAc:undecaprenyl-phosphate GlcNAc-1-phosphate transferase